MKAPGKHDVSVPETLALAAVGPPREYGVDFTVNW